MRETFKWYRSRKFSRTHSLLATFWYHKEKLKKLHFKWLAKKSDPEKEIPFPVGGYRQTNCADCRNDLQRQEIAMVSDRKGHITVQELKCERCKKHRPWWWFAKLPLTEEEQEIVNLRGGKAW